LVTGATFSGGPSGWFDSAHGFAPVIVFSDFGFDTAYEYTTDPAPFPIFRSQDIPPDSATLSVEVWKDGTWAGANPPVNTGGTLVFNGSFTISANPDGYDVTKFNQKGFL
jgi:hypothetical protein